MTTVGHTDKQKKEQIISHDDPTTDEREKQHTEKDHILRIGRNATTTIVPHT
jgi:hypothetical protein